MVAVRSISASYVARWKLNKSQGTVIHAGNRLATHESLDREQRMVALVNHGIDRYGRLGGTHDFHPAEHLRDEQKRAVQQILDSRDFAINLRGAAGTGKTATLQEIDRGLREAGAKSRRLRRRAARWRSCTKWVSAMP